MSLKVILAAVVLVATLAIAPAQSGFGGLPGGSYLDNVADSSAVKQGNRLVPFGVIAPPGVTNAYDERPYWSSRRISVGYNFTREVYRSRDVETHGVTPELYLESKAGLGLNLGVSYAQTLPQDSGYSVESERVGVSALPAQELLRFFGKPERTELWLGVALGYRWTDSKVATPGFIGGGGSYTTDSFSVEPNLVLGHAVSDRLRAMLVPSYGLRWDEGDNGSFNSGVFHLLGRLDFSICQQAILTAFAQWNSPIDPGGKDWAEFGGSIRAALCPRSGFRVGYSYEAFLDNVDIHHAFARFEFSF